MKIGERRKDVYFKDGFICIDFIVRLEGRAVNLQLSGEMEIIRKQNCKNSINEFGGIELKANRYIYVHIPSDSDVASNCEFLKTKCMCHDRGYSFDPLRLLMNSDDALFEAMIKETED